VRHATGHRLATAGCDRSETAPVARIRTLRARTAPGRTTIAGLLIGIAFLAGAAAADPAHSAVALAILVGSYPLYRGVAALLGKEARRIS
jgi:uncharacterized membrane protein HdeD (DUF308 family)